MPDLLFGLDLPAQLEPGYDPVAQAQRAERLGFDFVSTSDHPEGGSPTYETWTLLTWIAAHTSRIRVATRVLGVPYRSPAMVAKMAETLDRFSAGRLILGLGGGYAEHEFRAFGLTVPSPRDKVDGMADAIRIARGLWARPSFSHPGRVHHTAAANLEPKPDHPIPIWLGTYGPRALAVTGALADGWIPSLGQVGPRQVPALRSRIDTAAEAAGRSPADIRSVYNLGLRIDTTGRSSTVDESTVDESTVDESTVVGSAPAVAERLRGFVELGFTGFNFQLSGPDRADQIERLAQEVLPAVRA
jgi:alkanesulfonate monooxygenase SsuD/methylene tetrahydromethanopterin reductase-like flavin-dependent oxidoreductase (luciferase family)